MGPAQELENEWPRRLMQNQQNAVAEVAVKQGGEEGVSQAAERVLVWLKEDFVIGPSGRRRK